MRIPNKNEYIIETTSPKLGSGSAGSGSDSN